ncbi:hypothetical protein BESB_048450 [Besnoitia besnoiti]|uniref:Transmembrane protein n=1 Tax=Besnoitia besnoiti TaxID=94643 RepID=A0A2A9MLQ6_BESBE|nr:hypothetical protein BESB_048450 [Besnoitia besnoiti]PFH36653.1 hypothetical protein BESB_048450 [Besnoitia besnoiti]
MSVLSASIPEADDGALRRMLDEGCRGKGDRILWRGPLSVSSLGAGTARSSSSEFNSGRYRPGDRVASISHAEAARFAAQQHLSLESAMSRSFQPSCAASRRSFSGSVCSPANNSSGAAEEKLRFPAIPDRCPSSPVATDMRDLRVSTDSSHAGVCLHDLPGPGESHATAEASCAASGTRLASTGSAPPFSEEICSGIEGNYSYPGDFFRRAVSCPQGRPYLGSRRHSKGAQVVSNGASHATHSCAENGGRDHGSDVCAGALGSGVNRSESILSDVVASRSRGASSGNALSASGSRGNDNGKKTLSAPAAPKLPSRDRRIVFIYALLFLDVIIIGSTSTQHSLNPASLIDKVLMTHASFSSLTHTHPSGGESEQPYYRLLPHSVKRELGLSCVCGWAALVVLGILTLLFSTSSTPLPLLGPSAYSRSAREGDAENQTGEERRCEETEERGKQRTRNAERESRRSKGTARAGRPAAGDGGDEFETRFKNYERVILSQYGETTAAHTKLRTFLIALATLLVFFIMNFILQINVRCHITKYQLSHLHSLAAEVAGQTEAASETQNADEAFREDLRATSLPSLVAHVAQLPPPATGAPVGSSLARATSAAGMSDRHRRTPRPREANTPAPACASPSSPSCSWEAEPNTEEEADAAALTASSSAPEAPEAPPAASGAADASGGGEARRESVAGGLEGRRAPGGSEQTGQKASVSTSLSSASAPPAAGSRPADAGTETDSAESLGSEARSAVYYASASSVEQEEAPRSPSYLYYRDFWFWHQLVAGCLRDAELQLSLAWIAAHVLGVVLCVRVARDVTETLKGVVDAFRF